MTLQDSRVKDDSSNSSSSSSAKQKPGNGKLSEQARKAAEEGRLIFYSTEAGIPTGSSGTLYYNAAQSKLAGMSLSEVYCSAQ